MDSFITVLYGLIEHCAYGELTDEMLQDRMVVGLRDAKLSAKLQLDAKLTLAKVIQNARQSEQIKKQQPSLRSNFQKSETSEAEVDAVYKKQFKQRPKVNATPGASHPQVTACRWCGKSPSHRKSDCPAKNSTCSKCSKLGHWAAVCLSSKPSTICEVADQMQEMAFLESVEASGNNNAFHSRLPLNNTMIDFKIDTGADVTTIPHSYYTEEEYGLLKKPDKILTHAGGTSLECTGRFTGKISYHGKLINEEIYVLHGAKRPLLGRPAINAFRLVSTLNVVHSDVPTTLQQHPKLFNGLGKIPGEYVIDLKPDAQPFAVATPRRVAIPLLPTVKQELQRMEDLGVISKVDKPTDWCAPMVVVPKPKAVPNPEETSCVVPGEVPRPVRICVDLTKLNESVRRPRYTLPSIEQTLGQLAGARFFSKLDANSWFWQIPLSQCSAELTTFITPFGRYCFNRLPFGITSAPEYFQRKMQEILEGLEGIQCVMDDILITGTSQEIHDRRLQAVLQRLESRGITLNPKKCEFSKPSMSYIGQILSAEGIKANPAKVEALTKMDEPTDISGVRRFLGLANQLSKFTPDLAEKTKPLRDLLTCKNQWSWVHPQKAAFENIKTLLSTTPCLAHYDPQ